MISMKSLFTGAFLKMAEFCEGAACVVTIEGGVVRFVSCWFGLDFPEAFINTALAKALSL